MPPYLARWTGFVLGWVSAAGLRFYRQALAPLGIDEQHLIVLLTLENLGPQVQRRLSERAPIDTATMVRVVNDLERMGLAKRQLHPTDRRAYRVHLTDAGQRVIREAEEISDRGTEGFFGVLSTEEQRTLRELLVRLAEEVPPTNPARANE